MKGTIKKRISPIPNAQAQAIKAGRCLRSGSSILADCEEGRSQAGTLSCCGSSSIPQNISCRHLDKIALRPFSAAQCIDGPNSARKMAL